MRKLRIFLGDISHNYKTLSFSYVPYSVGLIASYANKIFGDAIEIKIFKWPDTLAKALDDEHCDILGVSGYIWNTGLAHWACKYAKKVNPNILTVTGGPNVHNPYAKSEYFDEHPYVDIRALLEGEVAFSNIIRLVLENGLAEKNNLFNDVIPGCIYKNKSNELVESYETKIDPLDFIPPPYQTGLLDEFLDGTLNIPLQTNRGCPFKCNFCHESDDYFNNIRFFDDQYVIDELDYIGNKMKQANTIAPTLIITDSNYGMYKRDLMFSEKVAELSDNTGWPVGIKLSTGKHFGNVMKNCEPLKDFFEFTMSVQSMNSDVLDAVSRKNIPIDKYKQTSIELREKGRDTLVELIFPMPKETLKSFFSGMEELIDMKVARITTNILMLLEGTIYRDSEYIKEWGISSKSRLLSRHAGIYKGEKVFEIDNVGIETKSLSFEDLLEINKFGLIVEMLFNSRIMRELEHFVEDYDLSYYDYIMIVYNNLDKSPVEVQEVFDIFIDLRKKELKNDENDLIEYYSVDDNFQKIMNGEEGGNCKYTAKSLLLSKYMESWLSYVFECLKELLIMNNHPIKTDFHDVLKFSMNKLHGIFDSRSSKTIIKENFSHDILTWLNNGKADRKKLSDQKSKSNYNIQFYYNSHQVGEREYLFDKFKDMENMYHMTNFIEGIRPQHRLFRKFEYV